MAQNKDLEEKLAHIRREGEERAAQRLAAKLKLKYLSLAKTPINVEALEFLPKEISEKSNVAVIQKLRDKIALVAVNPESPETKKVIKDLESREFKVAVFVVSPSGFKYVFDYYKFVGEKADEITGSFDIKKEAVAAADINSIEKVKSILGKQIFLGSNAAIIFEIVLEAAMANRASDIHFEPSIENTKLRFRIDGILNDIFSFSNQFYPYLVSRIKLLSGLKLNINTETQDGRFTIELAKKNVEVRVAVAPAQFGEVVVMRLLDPDAINIDLAELGLRKDDQAIIEAELKEPNGLILNTGPTGSGKTTTLYAFLKHVKSPEIKVITVEDPIEYQLQGIEQTQVDEESGYTFANGLRSIMRQDPDVILVGEIRDKETAEIGIQAALTGHLVFSTVHANSAAGAIPRLTDLGVRPQSVGPALNLIIAQRLVRRICQECKAPKQVDEELKTRIENFLSKLPARVNKNDYKEIRLFEPKGCNACNKSGFKGRVAVYELLVFEPEMEELILKQVGETAFQKFAVEKQMTTMQEDGILKVISGITTFEEIESVTGAIHWK